MLQSSHMNNLILHSSTQVTNYSILKSNLQKHHRGPTHPSQIATVGSNIDSINITPRVSECPVINEDLRIYYQNIQGLRNKEETLEYISRIMKQKKIHDYIITETHLEGETQWYLPEGQLMLHYGPNQQPTWGAKEELPLSSPLN